MQTQNLVFGFNLGAAAQLKIGAYGAGAAAAVDVGRTSGGVEFSLEREMKQVDTDQDPGPTATKEIRRVGKLKFNLAEVTLENLAIALNLPTTSVAAGKLSMGAPSGGELYRGVLIRGWPCRRDQDILAREVLSIQRRNARIYQR